MRRILVLAVAGLAFATPAAALCLRGVNIAGAEFGQMPGRAGFDYLYPTRAELDRLAASGASALRLPFRWERLQPVPGGPLRNEELALIDRTVADAEAAGLATILDLHNFGYYAKLRIGSPELPATAFADLWSKLASHVRDRRTVVLSLMNEPYDIEAETWLAAANAAIAAVRAAGAKQLVLVPGTGWTGAHSWQADLPTGNNAKVMLGVRDPADNYAYDVHQYLDHDFSGTQVECTGADRAAAAIDRMSGWLREHRKRAFLGEFGSSDRPECVAALRQLVSRVEAAPAQWAGWSAWAAGILWPPSYPLSLQPEPSGAARPQAAALQSFYAKARPRGGGPTCRDAS